MEKSNKTGSDNETILMALDQISQTIEVMTSVVGRLRHHVQQQEAAERAKAQQETAGEARQDQTLH